MQCRGGESERAQPAISRVDEIAHLAADEGSGAMRVLGGEQRVPHPTLRLVLDHHQPSPFDIAHLGRHLGGRGHGRIQAAWRGSVSMMTGLRERHLSRRLQHRQRLHTPGELRSSAGIDEPELRADFAPHASTAVKRTLCQNVLEARSRLRPTQCLEDLALAPHVVDYTRSNFLCSASLMGAGQG